MADKDLSCKKIEDYNEVFADIYNTLLFGENILNPDCLKAGATESIYKTDGNDLKDQRRDVLKKYQDEANLVISSFGIENQACLDKTMPIRVMGYDAGTYRQQITDREGKITPVITVVLNMSDRKWDTAKSIYEMLEVNEKLKAFVQDYRIHVFDIAFLEDSTIESFTSDFREIARFFQKKRLGENPLTSKNELRHPQAILEFLSAFTGDRSYLDGIKYLQAAKKEGGAVTMCAVAEALKTEGRLEGMQKGELLGKILAYHDMGLEIPEIAVKVGISQEETEQILQQHEG